MRVSADPVLSAALSMGDRPAAPATGEEAHGFEHLLRQAKKTREPEPSPTEATPRRMNWSPIAAALADKAGKEEAAGDNAGPEDGDDNMADPKAGENRPARDATPAPNLPVQDSGQWLLAAYDPDRRPVSPAPTSSSHDGESRIQKPAHAARQNIDTIGSEDAPAAETKMPITMAAPAQAGQSRTGPSFDTQPGPEIATDGPRAVSAERSLMPARTAEATPQAPADKNAAPITEKPTTTPVTVTAAQSFPAPAPAPVNPTITALAGAIADGGNIAPTLSASAGLTQPAQPVAAASHLLKIELHPAELGVVTASLRLSGGQLSIELKPENQEAHRRLSADSEALVKSLQGLGFAVDKVTVLQPSVAATATPRMDATPSPTGRDASSSQPGNPGGNGESSGGQHFGRNRGNEGQHGGHGGTPVRDRAGGGLFI